MPAADVRAAPLARALLAAPGQGDPLKTLEELTWLGVLGYEWPFGTFSRDGSGFPQLAYQPGAGLVCRPFYIPQDTRLTHYTTAGGSWEERKPGTGSPRVYY